MRVLVVGSGAREHALASRLASERDVGEIVCAPGNPGLKRIARLVAADVSRLEDLVDIVEREDIDFTVVGPELPLSLGLVDRLVERGRLVFGPTAAAARLESSKAFAKAFMARHGVPTARFEVADSAGTATGALRSGRFGFPVVLKADGLAAGKGVVIAQDLDAAESAVHDAMDDRRFGDAGLRLVIEECLSGPEVSFFVVSDGSRAVSIGAAQDHKRIFDDDRGPNTGGMGAFAPSPLVDERLHQRVMSEIVNPVISGMASEGHPFRGFLYVGLMLTSQGPKVIEFNVRLGDPEAQVVLPIVKGPLAQTLMEAATGRLGSRRLSESGDRLTGVVLAARNYPGPPETGHEILGLDAAEAVDGAIVFHAGTRDAGGKIVTAGGRVLTVVGRAPSYEQAIATAYEAASRIRFDGMQYRRDIGQKAVAAQSGAA
jgi:phosphoribosylamine--glycine ligase